MSEQHQFTPATRGRDSIAIGGVIAALVRQAAVNCRIAHISGNCRHLAGDVVLPATPYPPAASDVADSGAC